MIALDVEYHRPHTLAEAVEIFATLAAGGRSPEFYGGGTEIITEARLGRIAPGALIDLKAIPECRALERREGELVVGGARTLAEICEANPWPLLAAAAGRVADHTTRCKITLGGHLAGKIQYREAVLPFLLAETSHVVTAGPAGVRRQPFARVFDQTLRLDSGEFLVQVGVREEELGLPFFCVKKTRLDWVDYPLLTLAGMRADTGPRIALSGMCDFPFRWRAGERTLAGTGDLDARLDAALRQLPAPVVDDIHGSAEYRRFVLRRTLIAGLQQLGG